MPMILMDGDVPAWIEAGELTSAKAESMLHPYPGDRMERMQISSRVNNPQNDDAGVLTSSLQT
jgi:putative SOS response-associated peptidase YedK